MTVKQKKTLTLFGIIALVLAVGIGTIVVVTRLSTTEKTVAPTAPESKPKAAEWYGGEACNATFTIEGPTTGTINICTVIIDPTNQVVDGSTAPDANKVETIASNDVNLSSNLTSNLDTPLTLGDDVLLADGTDDAECVTFTDLEFGNYQYGEEVITSDGDWMDPKYYDFLLPGAGLSLANLTTYGSSAFSDGAITLNTTNPVVTLVVLNQYAPQSCNSSCSTDTDCADGLDCIGGMCRNSSCSAETDCTCDIPTETPTATPTGASCNNACSVNSDCAGGLICSGGACRNSSCVNEADCVCDVATGTPTLPQCSDGIDNDGDGKIDCTPGNPDPGCFPDGKGGGDGNCNPNDNDERDATARATQLPDAGISLPTLGALGGGVVMVLLGILLAL